MYKNLYEEVLMNNKNQLKPKKNDQTQLSLKTLDGKIVGGLVDKVQQFLSDENTEISIETMDEAYAICEIMKQIHLKEKRELGVTFQELSAKLDHVEMVYNRLQENVNGMSEGGINQSVKSATDDENDNIGKEKYKPRIEMPNLKKSLVLDVRDEPDDRKLQKFKSVEVKDDSNKHPFLEKKSKDFFLAGFRPIQDKIQKNEKMRVVKEEVKNTKLSKSPPR